MHLTLRKRRSAARRIHRSAAPRAAGLELLEPRVMFTTVPYAMPLFVFQTAANGVTPAISSSPTGMSPSKLRHAYGIDNVSFAGITGDGTGQTIAIVDAYNAPTIAADLHTFNTTFGLPDTTLTIVGQTGTSALPGNDPSGPGNSWAVETSLDVEWAHAVAPKATILLVLANSSSFSDLLTAVDTARNYAGVSTVSMSWGSDEFSGETNYDFHFTTPAGHGGVTFLAASGDAGAYSSGTTTKIAGFPAASRNVVGVGGTLLSTDSSGNYLSESGWGNGTSSGTSGGAGGGISKYVTQPSYQTGIVTQTTTFRAIPDVGMDASPSSGVSVIDSYDFGSTPWLTVGGTSLATPLWAGVLAIADQGRALNGLTSLDGSTQTLPMLYALPSSDFHDITTGNNGYAAGAGYDLVTGRGSPIVSLLAPALAGTPASPVPVIGALGVNPTSIVSGTASVTLTATSVHESTGSNTITSVSFFRESNGTSGLQTASDFAIGSGSVNGTTYTITTNTAGLAAGSYTFYAVATDSANVTSTVASVTLTVTAPAPANDNFASAIFLTGTTATATGTSINATKQSGEPTIAGNAGGHSVWYAWTAASTGKVTLTTAGSSFDTLLGVYTGTAVNALTAIATNDDASSSVTTSSVTFTPVAGKTYYLAVDGYNAASGTVKINLSQAAPAVAPANDNFANAITLTGSAATITGATNVNATKESGEPSHAGNTGGHSIWYNWTAPANGTVTLNTAGSSFDTLLGVYKGTAVNALTTVASNDDVSSTNRTSAVTFTAVAGTTYRIAVDGWAGATGTVNLNLSFVQSAVKQTAGVHAAVATAPATAALDPSVYPDVDLITHPRRRR